MLLRLLGPAQDEPRPRVHRRTVALGQVVIDGDLVPGIEQFFGANRTDIPGAAGDKNIHKKHLNWRVWATQRGIQVSVVCARPSKNHEVLSHHPAACPHRRGTAAAPTRRGSSCSATPRRLLMNPMRIFLNAGRGARARWQGCFWQLNRSWKPTVNQRRCSRRRSPAEAAPCRPYETLKPLADHLKLRVLTPYGPSDYAALARHILSDATSTGRPSSSAGHTTTFRPWLRPLGSSPSLHGGRKTCTTASGYQPTRTATLFWPTCLSTCCRANQRNDPTPLGGWFSGSTRKGGGRGSGRRPTEPWEALGTIRMNSHLGPEHQTNTAALTTPGLFA